MPDSYLTADLDKLTSITGAIKSCWGQDYSPSAVCQRSVTRNARSSPKSPHSPGGVHRKQRKMLAPAFSVEHLRGLVPIFYEVTHKARPSPSRFRPPAR